MNEANSETLEKGRIGIIQAVQTPLGFFVLLVLFVEAVFGLLVQYSDGNDRTLIIQAMIVLIFALVAIVTFLAIFRLDALMGILRQSTVGNYSLLIGPPDNMRSLDLTLISWNNEDCFIVCGDWREKISLVPSRIGPAFRVHIPKRVLEKIKDDAITLALKDKKGNRWEVKSFYLFENLQPLSLIETRDKILQEYGEEYQ